jgi:hypothetical protein
MTTPFVPMSKEDVAAVLMCAPRTVENLVKSRRIPTPRLLAGRVFWHPDVFYSWLDSELRKETDEHCCDGNGASDSDAEVRQQPVKRGGRKNVESKGPAARMKAAQAARMVLPGHG